MKFVRILPAQYGLYRQPFNPLTPMSDQDRFLLKILMQYQPDK